MSTALVTLKNAVTTIIKLVLFDVFVYCLWLGVGSLLGYTDALYFDYVYVLFCGVPIAIIIAILSFFVLLQELEKIVKLIRKPQERKRKPKI